MKSAPDVWEMTWSLAFPDGRATFEIVSDEAGMLLRWLQLVAGDRLPHRRPCRHSGPSTMELRRPVLLLALVGPLVACGDNTDLRRGETTCDYAGQDAANTHDVRAARRPALRRRER